MLHEPLPISTTSKPIQIGVTYSRSRRTASATASMVALSHARGPRPPHARHEGDRGCNVWPDRTLARSRCGPDHGARDEAGAARRPHPRVRRQSPPLLRTCAQERSLRFVRGDAALGYPQPGNLHRRGARRPDPSGRCGRRRWRHHLRHQDAGNGRSVRRDEVWIGNLTPIDDKRASESVTCALPINTPGVSFWAREPYERHARHEADYPLSFRFDETDTVLVCDLVKVPWERVFLHNNGAVSRRIYIETPANNCYQNHQSNVRFWTKMGLIVGL